jgi:threonine aldolase
MRQAGVLAAAGIVALNEMVERLADDHANARKLADGLAEMPGLAIDPSLIKTDIVYFEVKRDDMTVEELVQALADQGIRMLPVGPGRIRAVTHYHITTDDIDYTLVAFSKVLKKKLT